jgi:hypothetical protein
MSWLSQLRGINILQCHGRPCHIDQAHKRLALDLQKKDLKDAPGFVKHNWPDFIEQEVVIYEFYDVPQPSEKRTEQSVQ